MLDKKIDGLLGVCGYKKSEFATHMGVTRQAYNNKKKANSFKAVDLIKLAELTNTTLTFMDDKGKPVITLDTNDIPTQKRTTHD